MKRSAHAGKQGMGWLASYLGSFRKPSAVIFCLLFSVFQMISCGQDRVREQSENVESSLTGTQGGARIHFEKVRYDFGEIYHADRVNHEFVFTNAGTSELIIQGARASCGCTTPTYPKEPIQPGESGSIKIEYNSVGKQGRQKATIRIQSNDISSPETVLYLSGKVLVKP